MNRRRLVVLSPGHRDPRAKRNPERTGVQAPFLPIPQAHPKHLIQLLRLLLDLLGRLPLGCASFSLHDGHDDVGDQDDVGDRSGQYGGRGGVLLCKTGWYRVELNSMRLEGQGGGAYVPPK